MDHLMPTILTRALFVSAALTLGATTVYATNPVENLPTEDASLKTESTGRLAYGGTIKVNGKCPKGYAKVGTDRNGKTVCVFTGPSIPKPPGNAALEGDSTSQTTSGQLAYGGTIKVNGKCPKGYAKVGTDRNGKTVCVFTGPSIPKPPGRA